MPKRIATWNPERDCWELDDLDLISGRPVVWSETWPPSGMTRRGVVYELPTLGAPHGRFRVFVVAWPAADADRLGRERTGSTRRQWDGPADARLLPTPTGRDWKGHNQRGDDTCLTGALLPTPAVNDMGEGKTVDAWDEWTATMQAKHGNGNGHGKSLAIETQRLLPTPEASRAGGTPEAHMARKLAAAGGSQRLVCTNLDLIATQPETWGVYADAIARWEQFLGRPAPPPTQPSKKGTPQLSPAFSEWMMGLPAGHVTAVPGLTRNDQLKALGNGVVPQQAAAAVQFLLNRIPTTTQDAA